MKYLFCLLCCLVIGCQQMPTKVVSQEPVIGQGVTAESLMKDQPVILDVRPAFEFNLLHVPGAINVRWEDFSQSNPKSRGLLQADLFSVARRLSLIGIDPSTKVLVLGKGPLGHGEEGRVAWTLKVLGVQNVYTILHTSYREMNPRKDEPLMVTNKAYWKPVVDEKLNIDLNTFKALTPKPGDSVVVLDVRSAQEFALRNYSHLKNQKFPVVNVEWKEFFAEKGLPLATVEKVLATHSISKQTKIIVISNHGVRSGAVTYALNYLGYKNVSNFAGGYEQWK